KGLCAFPRPPVLPWGVGGGGHPATPLSLLGLASERPGEAGRKITRVSKIPALPRQIRQKGGRRSLAKRTPKPSGRGRGASPNSPENAARERTRVRNLRQAFQSLQAALPSVPPDTKLSKLDVLVLATNYIAHLTEMLDQGGSLCDHPALQRAEGYLHPVKVTRTSAYMWDITYIDNKRKAYLENNIRCNKAGFVASHDTVVTLT
uniref:Transcription factor 23 n=1 Tax=Electrophorus electricus TaxID=8005 RepID=A0A4W4FFQ4_ELEEL